MNQRETYLFAVVLAALLGGCARSSAPSTTARDVLAQVNPLVGTQSGAADYGTGGGAGNTFPGATLPFGMAQLSPDTTPSTDNFAGGYTYSDTRIKGFSLTHISGAGCAILQDVPMLPLAREITSSPVPPLGAGLNADLPMLFDHAHEQAQPGYYAVRLDPAGAAPVDVELTATLHGGALRIRYPADHPATLLVNAGGSAMADSAASITVDPARREISGSASSGRFCFQDNRYTVYFAAVFDQPLRSTGTWQKQAFSAGGTRASDTGVLPVNYEPVPGGPASIPGNPSGTAQAGAVLGFEPGATVLLRVAISYVSVDNARANLAAELAGRDFDALRAAAQARWQHELARIELGAGADPRWSRVFYTALYHALLSPSVFSDVNGDYLGMDGQVHRETARMQYQTFSGWDVYRTQLPLLAMLDPQRAGDMMQSLVVDAQQSGWLPKWSYANQQTDTMVGDPAAPTIAGAYAFGVRNFDTAAAFEAMLKGATQSGHANNPVSLNNAYVERQALDAYQSLGYVPHELDSPLGGIGYVLSSDFVWGSAATTLEYALADFAVGRFADATGQGARADALRARAGNWKNLLNPATRAIEPRSALGTFQSGYDATSGDGFVEGDGAQYTWFVPHDVAGLIAALGGEDAAARRLDTFFTQINAGPKSAYAYLGNEPTLFTPWLYAWLRRPAQTGPLVQRALTTLYDDAPTGMPGNDDLGTMSAWWVLSALGLMPAVPGTDTLLLNAPLFPAATLHLPAGDLRIVRDGQGATVQGLTRDGVALDRAWLHFSDIAHGGTLRYAVGASADTSGWATDMAALPPSNGASAVDP
ncbi:MAG: glycoside hydrolase family 92 protein [Nevskiaceae bacterium]|nr:MAG: glycoside hydrolase family 92 protein [Nevskiaceae bacterium]